MDGPIERREHEEFCKRMEDEHKRIHHRIKDVEDTVRQIYDLTSSVERLAVSVEQMAQTQKEHAEQLEDLESRDGEKWRQAVGYTVTVIISILIGFLASNIY